jgi:hypothetical protein
VITRFVSNEVQVSSLRYAIKFDDQQALLNALIGYYRRKEFNVRDDHSGKVHTSYSSPTGLKITGAD